MHISLRMAESRQFIHNPTIPNSDLVAVVWGDERTTIIASQQASTLSIGKPTRILQARPPEDRGRVHGRISRTHGMPWGNQDIFPAPVLEHGAVGVNCAPCRVEGRRRGDCPILLRNR